MKGQMLYQIKVTPAESREVKRVCDEMGLDNLSWNEDEQYILVDMDDLDYITVDSMTYWSEYDTKISPQDFIEKYGKQKTRKFKVGDRVRTISNKPKGKIGTVVFIDSDNEHLVKFDNWYGGHDGLNCGNSHHCGRSWWFMGENELELAPEQDVCASNISSNETLDLEKLKGYYRLAPNKEVDDYWSSIHAADAVKYASCLLNFGTSNKTNKKGLMSYLRDIPKRVKLALKKELQAMYQLGWIDSETFEPTEKGINEMHQMLWDRKDVKEEMGERATAEVRRIKEEEKEK